MAGYELGDWLFNDHIPKRLVNLLAVPLPLSCRRKPHIPTVALGRLPASAEVLLHIFEKIDNLHDALSLGLTNTTILAVGRKPIHTLASAAHASWAGGRIICIGSDTKREDLPLGMLTPAEESDIFTAQASETDAHGIAKREHDSPPKACGTLHTYVGEHFHKLVPGRFPSILGAHQYRLRPMERTLSDALTLPRYVAGNRSDSSWVLCNITKRQYVRANATVALSRKTAAGPFIDEKVGLGEVLATLICCSGNPSTSIPNSGSLHRGKWAGDRIEITTVGRLRAGKRLWKDVSKEVLNVVAEIWDAEHYGGSWRPRVVDSM
ncbi:hypothetical protein BKA93DRAFT_821662 [Sparassis latifolia]